MPRGLRRLELTCFGPPTALVDGREAPPEVLWHRHLALLIYLALSPRHARSRDHLLGLLWGERPQDRARHALNEAVSRLRHALGDDRLRSEADALVLNDAALDVDARRFAAAAESTPDDALALLRGDFLEGFHVEDASEFDDWMTRERERYHALAVSVLVAAGERRLTVSRFRDANDAARRALARESHCEPAVRLLMRASALAGDSAGALAAYQEFADRVKRDLGEQPSKALSGLADRIRSQTWRPTGAGNAAAEPPLVGRERAHRDAFDTISQGLAHGPCALVITGPPGMGCTRLLSECGRRLALEGAVVVLARPVESDHDARWSALRLLLRAGLADAPGLLAARREALGALAGLAPELVERFPPREVKDVADMASAVADVLAAASEERPIAIALDDAHWADGPSLAALGSAVATIHGKPVLLLLTVAQGVADPPRELLQLESDVGRRVQGMTVRLGALSQDELLPLVRALAPWCKDEELRARLTRRIALESGGSPFFAVTLLGALERAQTLREDLLTWPPPGGTLDAPLPFSMPSLVRMALAVRVGELGPEEQAILQAASVCGGVLDIDLLAQVTGRAVADVERALPAFERRQLVTFDGRRYTFAAPLVAEVVRAECLTRGERRRLERRVIEGLGQRTDLDSRGLAAELLAHAAPDERAFDLALGVARDALAAGAARVARRALAAAERISQDARLDRTRLDELRARTS
jgi:DNA-binding SARP family transcriptional activator